MSIHERELVIDGRDDLRARFLAPADARGALPGVVLIVTATHADAARRLAEGGFAVLALALADDLAASDVRALGVLERALEALGERTDVDAARVACVGVERGGSLAFLLACRSTRVAAVVDLFGPLVYPELSRARPIQPLEMVLNLGCPVLALFRDDDPATPAAHVALARAALSRSFKHFDIVTYPGAGKGSFEDRSALEDAWRRTLSFLSASLELGAPP